MKQTEGRPSPDWSGQQKTAGADAGPPLRLASGKQAAPHRKKASRRQKRCRRVPRNVSRHPFQPSIRRHRCGEARHPRRARPTPVADGAHGGTAPPIVRKRGRLGFGDTSQRLFSKSAGCSNRAQARRPQWLSSIRLGELWRCKCGRRHTLEPMARWLDSLTSSHCRRLAAEPHLGRVAQQARKAPQACRALDRFTRGNSSSSLKPPSFEHQARHTSR